jgi:hypothetical protein
MKKATQYRMLVLADSNAGTFPMVDLAQQVNGQWLSLEAAKTTEQLNQESATAFLSALATNGAATYYGPVKLVSYAHGLRLCRAYEKEQARCAAALPASYHAARARRFSTTH